MTSDSTFISSMSKAAAVTLIVTPAGESILIDSGYPDNNGRDLKRILNVVRDVAGLDHIDHAAVTHWHRDHYGNHAALAAEIDIRHFYDRGIPDALQEDPEFEARIAELSTRLTEPVDQALRGRHLRSGLTSNAPLDPGRRGQPRGDSERR